MANLGRCHLVENRLFEITFTAPTPHHPPLAPRQQASSGPSPLDFVKTTLQAIYKNLTRLTFPEKMNKADQTSHSFFALVGNGPDPRLSPRQEGPRARKVKVAELQSGCCSKSATSVLPKSD